jgi:hypothetical protein
VDGVLTGHDHFYARNYRMGHVAEKPQQGVLFLTTAGGGAGLYRCKKRDYVAFTRSVHHFTLFEFDGDQVKLSAITANGEIIDRYTLTKKPTPAKEYCAYEIEEFRRHLKMALSREKPIKLFATRGGQKAAGSLQVPTRFPIPISGELVWGGAKGWKLKYPKLKFRLKPGEPLTIPLEAELSKSATLKSPVLRIAFDEGKFINRTIEVSPFKLAGPREVKARKLIRELKIDGKQHDPAWDNVPGYFLLPLALDQPSIANESHRVQLLADKKWVYVRTLLSDPAGDVDIPEPDPSAEGSRLVLSGEHVRVVLSDGVIIRKFAISPESIGYSTWMDEESFSGLVKPAEKEGKKEDWRGVVKRCKDGWCVIMAISRTVYRDWGKVRINVVHRQKIRLGKSGRRFIDFELCPTYKMGSDPDRISDWSPWDRIEEFAQLVCE